MLRGQTQKATYCIIPFILHYTTFHLYDINRMKNRAVVATGGGQWEELTTKEQHEGILGGYTLVLCLDCVVVT